MGDVTAIEQDLQGFMWFGGGNGLVRFDGYTYRSYRSVARDPSSLAHNHVLSLLVDRQGVLWVGTVAGLHRYHPNTDNFTRFTHQPTDPQSLSHNYIRGMIQDGSGTLWLATRGGGLNRYQGGGHFERFLHEPHNPNSLASNYVDAIAEDQNGQLWLGLNDRGLDRFDPQTQTFHHYRHEPTNPRSLSFNTVNELSVDARGTVWVATYGGGLNRYVPQSDDFIRYQHSPQNPTSLGDNVINTLLRDRQGHMWLGVKDKGLNRYRGERTGFEPYMHKHGDPRSLYNNKVTVIFQDNTDGLWFGHFPTGVSRLDRYASAFRNYTHRPNDLTSLSNHAIVSLAEDAKGHLWVGTENGLNHLNPQTGTVLQRYQHSPHQPEGLRANSVLSVLADGPEQIWVGTWRGGLSRLNTTTGQFKHYPMTVGLPGHLDGDEIWALLKDRQGNIWAGTEKGVNRYHREQDIFTPLNVELKTLGDIEVDIRLLFEDSQGLLWYGGLNGLFRVNRQQGQFKHYLHRQDEPRGVSADHFWAVAEDQHRNLWFGTASGGVSYWHRQSDTFKAYLSAQGLSDNIVTGALQDEQGHMWFGSMNGLSRYDPTTDQWRIYDTTYGLAGDQYNRAAYLKTSRGELAFGSTEGLSIFNPSDIPENTTPPPVVITQLYLSNKPVAIGVVQANGFVLNQAISQTQALTFTHKQSVFSFEYVALNYRSPEKNQYAYTLEGFDLEWNVVGTRRLATYTNLDPGKYVFRVKASNNEGVWNEQGTAITLWLLPPWWRTWWAYCGYVVSIGGVLALVLYGVWRKKQVQTERRLNRHLEHKVAERTEQLSQSFAELNLAHEHLKNTQSQLVQSEKMSGLGTLVAGVGHEINNPTHCAYLAVHNLQKRMEEFRRFLFNLVDEETDDGIKEAFNQHFDAMYQDINSAKEGNKRVKDIVANLRTFSRVDSGVCVAENAMAHAHLAEGLRSTLTLVETNFKQKVVFEFEVQDDPALACCPSELNQVFMNLMVNACQAMVAHNKPGEQATLHVSMQIQGDQLGIVFKDNGPGMEAAVLQRIFEPFFTTKTEGDGTGLGLSISFGIVQRHGGRIEVASQEGSGTRFEVLLPLVPKP